MDIKILVATPDHHLGEQISQALDEAGYHPIFVSGIAEATFVGQGKKCPIAILDCNLPDPGTAYLATELRARNDDLRIAFIRRGDCDGKPIEIRNKRDIDLPEPFFLPDLLEVINLWATEKKAADEETSPPPNSNEIPTELAWLQDVNRAAQYLTRLSLEANAQAALILRDSQIWAYAGQLAQSAAEELTNFVGHYWANGDGSDLARFVRLDTTGNEYMLYATSLGSGFVLALSFETEMPFSEMRAQTGKLARKLTSPPAEIPAKFLVDPVLEKQPQLDEIDDFSPEDWVPEDDFPADETEEEIPEDEAIIARQQAMFEDLLATLDIPDPDGASTTSGVQANYQVEVQTQEPAPPQKTREAVPATVEAASIPQTEPITKTDVQLESISPAVHDLAYACVLIPRLPEHHLTGVLTGLLNVEMMRLCLAFGWRLEHLAIRPQYLHWVVSVGPEVPAAQVIEKIRDQTSAILFEEFPRLAKENPSGDFWAQGFMVIHGRRSLTGTLVKEFIQQTRTRQGLENLI